MSKFRIVEKGGDFYVERRYWVLFWLKIGIPAPPDGGWAGPQRFKDSESAHEWVAKLLRKERLVMAKKKAPKRIVHEV